MTSILVQLTSETEQELRLQASRHGQTLEGYLAHLAERAARGTAEIPDRLDEGVRWLTDRGETEINAARERILNGSPTAREIPTGKSVLDMIEGKWPGTETDSEIRHALDEIS